MIPVPNDEFEKKTGVPLPDYTEKVRHHPLDFLIILYYHNDSKIKRIKLKY